MFADSVTLLESLITLWALSVILYMTYDWLNNLDEEED